MWKCGEQKVLRLSEYFLVEVRLKLVGGWRSAGRMEGVRNVLKESELINNVKEWAYQDSLPGKYEVWSGGEVESVEKEWWKVQRYYSNGVYQYCLARRRRKGSEWWNEEVGRTMAEKRRAFEEWLERRDRVTYDRYRAQRVVVKRAVQVEKRMALRRWGEWFRG